MPLIRRTRPAALALLAALAPAGAALAGQTFSVTVNQPASSVTSNTTASAPFTGTLVGENNPARPAAEQTRTKRWSNPFNPLNCGGFTSTTQNETVNISATFQATGGTPAGSPARPGGAFRLGIDPAAGTASVRRLDMNLLASGAVNVNASLNNATYQSFCTTNPSCSAFFFTAIPSLPVGVIQLTSVLVKQDPGATAVGMLAPGSGGGYTFTVPVDVIVTPSASFGGSPLALDPTPLQIVLTGTVTPSGTTAAVTASTNINLGPQTNTTPTPIAETPFAVPSDSILCPSINIKVAGTMTSTSFTTTNAASLTAAGPRVPCVADYDGNFTVDLLDIFAFLEGWFAGAPAADTNGAGGVDLLDIFAFLEAWFYPAPGC